MNTIRVVLLFRPEARANYDGRTESYEAWEADPFEGMEIFAILNEDGISDEALHDQLQAEAAKHPGWKFHIETWGGSYVSAFAEQQGVNMLALRRRAQEVTRLKHSVIERMGEQELREAIATAEHPDRGISI